MCDRRPHDPEHRCVRLSDNPAHWCAGCRKDHARWEAEWWPEEVPPGYEGPQDPAEPPCPSEADQAAYRAWLEGASDWVQWMEANGWPAEYCGLYSALTRPSPN